MTSGGVLGTAAPVLPADKVTALLRDSWGVTAGSIQALDSERDANLLVDGRYVLKVSNPAEDPAVIDMENTAMAHALRVSPGLPIPTVVPTVHGPTVAPFPDGAGRACLARLITVLPGRRAQGEPIGTGVAAQIGALGARASVALQGLFHRAGDRVLDWDVRRAPAVLSAPGVLAGMGDLGARLAGVLPRLSAAAGATAAFPAGINHADVTLTNVLIGPDGVTGLIDFGDMHHTAHVCDLAVTLAAVLRNNAEQETAGTWELAAAVLDGYQRHRPLTPEEAAVIGDLVVARLGLTLAISHRLSTAFPGNTAYVSQYDDGARRFLAEWLDLGLDAVCHRLGRIAGTSRVPGGQRAAARHGGSASLLDRRRAVTGGALSPLFYSRPLEIVRGEGPWLFAADGTRYLDAYNNVAVVGHTHPTVVQSVNRQNALLNTHSRYLHEGIVELAERLLATMPDGLDTILFTTSGTEANDLAWRMATAHTGGTGAIIAEHAYHGASKWLTDLSSNEWPPGYRPAHVGTFAAPRLSAGGADHRTALSRVTEAAAGLAATGDRAALVLADPGFTSEGILNAPAEFLSGLVDGAHQAGALFLADEVQSGFGRVGPAFWRFALAGITPDFVTLGKPMGAGYPIGALITRRGIADSLARDYEYFSTFAASPAAAAASLAVLDVLAQEKLPENAARVGDYLRTLLGPIAQQHPRLGEVRGTGLLAGIDILTPEGTPSGPGARPYAKALLDALTRQHVLAGLTGPAGTVLKVRPPLVWQEEHAARFASAVTAALADLG